MPIPRAFVRCAVVLLALAGCAGSTAPTYDISGRWYGFAEQSGDADMIEVDIDVTDADGNLTGSGTVTLRNYDVFSVTLAGDRARSSVNLVLTWDTDNTDDMVGAPFDFAGVIDGERILGALSVSGVPLGQRLAIHRREE